MLPADWLLIENLWLTDLYATAEFLKDQYKRCDPRPTDPASLLRSFLLMLFTQRGYSITPWVDELRRDNREISRYRLDEKTILEFGQRAAELGYKTLVLQSDEDEFPNSDRLSFVLVKLKKLGVAPTLSIGEKGRDGHAAGCGGWRNVRPDLPHDGLDPVVVAGGQHPGDHGDGDIATRWADTGVATGRQRSDAERDRHRL